MSNLEKLIEMNRKSHPENFRDAESMSFGWTIGMGIVITAIFYVVICLWLIPVQCGYQYGQYKAALKYGAPQSEIDSHGGETKGLLVLSIILLSFWLYRHHFRKEGMKD
tara:strand:- start:25123 stop:25449 length:327 start_codon:yes stop_codon:yes gene_type:complete